MASVVRYNRRALEQIVGRERNQRACHPRDSNAYVVDRRRVNSTVIAPRTNGKTCSLNQRLNGFAFSAGLGADETWVVGRRYNKSLDRSAFSRLVIRKTRVVGSLSPRPVNSTVIRLRHSNVLCANNTLQSSHRAMSLI